VKQVIKLLIKWEIHVDGCGRANMPKIIWCAMKKCSEHEMINLELNLSFLCSILSPRFFPSPTWPCFVFFSILFLLLLRPPVDGLGFETHIFSLSSSWNPSFSAALSGLKFYACISSTVSNSIIQKAKLEFQVPYKRKW
jgi:hypothetical protein